MPGTLTASRPSATQPIARNPLRWFVFAVVIAAIDTPGKLQECLVSNTEAVSRAYELLSAFQEHLEGDDVVRGVEPSSSDPLLMLVLEKHADNVLRRHPGGRGKGSPPRIASIARRFVEMQRERAEGAAT